MTTAGFLLFCGALGFALAVAVMMLILRRAARQAPGGRAPEFHHTHEIPIPRTGGIGLAVALVAVSIAYLIGDFADFRKENVAKILVASLAMFALGLWDDLKPIGARYKLIGQLLIASAAFFMGIDFHRITLPFTESPIELGFWAGPLTVIWLVSLTNLINLIDGLDGLAGGISLMMMILLAYVGGGSCVSCIAAGMIGALAGFLKYNLPPARIYLGDGGAYFLGFLIGCLSLISSQKGAVFGALIAPMFVLALPILDTSLAILRRGLGGLPLFRADRRHLHHRLLNTGIDRREVVIGAYVFTAFFLILGFIVYWNHARHLPIVLGFAALFILLTAGKLSFTNEWFSVGRVLGNSMAMRAEIQFALAQTRWLVMDAARGANLDGLCEDTAFIARKLGFAGLRIQLGATEKNWPLNETSGENVWRIEQKLPGHPECRLTLTAAAPAPDEKTSAPSRFRDQAAFEIVGELLAEGWVKAVHEWVCRNPPAPLRFNDQPPV